MTRAEPLCQEERGPTKQRAREAGPPRREESWAPEEGGQWELEGLPRGTAGIGGAVEVAEAEVHRCVQCAQ